MAAIAEMLFSCGGGTLAQKPVAIAAAPAPVAPASAPVAVPATVRAPEPAVSAAVSAAIASLPACPHTHVMNESFVPSAHIDPPRGLYVMVPAGIEVADRRRTALAVAASLAPRGGTTAVFLLEGGAADAHVLGEPACGRLGPEHTLDPADTGGAIRQLLSQCDQVVVVPLDSSGSLPRGLAGSARRTVFVAAADAESVVETYRELKAWRARGLALPASLFVVGTDGAAEAGRVVGRLRRASREFLGCDLASQGFLASEDSSLAAEHPEPPRILSHAPVGEIWPRILGVEAEAPAAGGVDRETLPASDVLGRVIASETSETSPAAHPPPPAAKIRDSHLLLGGAVQQKAYPRVSESIVPVAAARDGKIGDCPSFLGCEPALAPVAPVAPEYSVFSPWRPEGREELVAAIEAQPAVALGKSLRQVLRVEVDEPDAPPLAAVRDDGALVAILLASGGETPDTRAATRWLTVHRRLLSRAYPYAGIREDAAPTAIVLAPAETPPADGLRRFLPIQLGGHRGIVLLP